MRRHLVGAGAHGDRRTEHLFGDVGLVGADRSGDGVRGGVDPEVDAVGDDEILGLAGVLDKRLARLQFQAEHAS